MRVAMQQPLARRAMGNIAARCVACAKRRDDKPHDHVAMPEQALVAVRLRERCLYPPCESAPPAICCSAKLHAYTNTGPHVMYVRVCCQVKDWAALVMRDDRVELAE